MNKKHRRSFKKAIPAQSIIARKRLPRKIKKTANKKHEHVLNQINRILEILKIEDVSNFTIDWAVKKYFVVRKETSHNDSIFLAIKDCLVCSDVDGIGVLDENIRQAIKDTKQPDKKQIKGTKTEKMSIVNTNKDSTIFEIFCYILLGGFIIVITIDEMLSFWSWLSVR